MRRDAWPRAEKTLAFPSAADVARPLPKKQSLRRSALFAGSASNVPHLRIVHSHRAFAPTPCTTVPRYSGLQRDVLSLYRQCLRVARKKPTVRFG